MHQSRFFFPSDFFNQSHNSHAVANGLLLGHTQIMQTLSPPSMISSWGNYTPFPINLAVNKLQPECRGSGGAIKRSSPGGHDKSPFHGMNTVAAAPTELFFKEGMPTSPPETFGELNETAILTKSTPKQKSPKHEVSLFIEDKNHSQGGNSLHIKASTLDMVLQGWRGGTVRNNNKGKYFFVLNAIYVILHIFIVSLYGKYVCIHTCEPMLGRRPCVGNLPIHEMFFVQ